MEVRNQTVSTFVLPTHVMKKILFFNRYVMALAPNLVTSTQEEKNQTSVPWMSRNQHTRPRHWFPKYIIILHYCIHYKLISVAGNGTRAGAKLPTLSIYTSSRTNKKVECRWPVPVNKFVLCIVGEKLYGVFWVCSFCGRVWYRYGSSVWIHLNAFTATLRPTTQHQSYVVRRWSAMPPPPACAPRPTISLNPSVTVLSHNLQIFSEQKNVFLTLFPHQNTLLTFAHTSVH